MFPTGYGLPTTTEGMLSWPDVENGAEAYAKYHTLGYSPGPDSWSDKDGGGLRVLVPTRALAWFSFPSDATRFTFTDVPGAGS